MKELTGYRGRPGPEQLTPDRAAALTLLGCHLSHPIFYSLIRKSRNQHKDSQGSNENSMWRKIQIYADLVCV